MSYVDLHGWSGSLSTEDEPRLVEVINDEKIDSSVRVMGIFIALNHGIINMGKVEQLLLGMNLVEENDLPKLYDKLSEECDSKKTQ